MREERWQTRDAVSLLLISLSARSVYVFQLVVWLCVLVRCVQVFSLCVCVCVCVCICVCSFTPHTFLLTNQIPGPDRQRGPPRCLACPRRGALTGAKGEGDVGGVWVSVELPTPQKENCRTLGEECEEEGRVVKESREETRGLRGGRGNP